MPLGIHQRPMKAKVESPPQKTTGREIEKSHINDDGKRQTNDINFVVEPA